ncbi:hypothetical protein ELK40_16185 [Enterobacter sp. N18-03635]|nr:hypothetical protein [Enterobacter sp. N18-03635]AZV06602.1 hypothetical protein ELK40_16185 [Enterobacter sp. N18-03635]
MPQTIHSIYALKLLSLYDKLSCEALTSWFGYVRAQIKATRDELDVEGKKKYEAYIGKAAEKAPTPFGSLKRPPDTLTDLINIPSGEAQKTDGRFLKDFGLLLVSLRNIAIRALMIDIENMPALSLPELTPISFLR